MTTGGNPLPDWQWQRAVLRALAAADDPSLVIAENHEPSTWLRDRFRSGPTSWCAHIALPLNPGTTAAVLTMADGSLTCGPCAATADATVCDRCGQRSISTDQPDVKLLVGLLVVVFRLCEDCASLEFPGHHPAVSRPPIGRTEPR